MFEPERDQPLGKAQRDQPLRRSARDLQHFCDLVLGVAGDEIEPAGARGFVETRFFVVRRGHRILPPVPAGNFDMRAKIDRHPVAGRGEVDHGTSRKKIICSQKEQ